MPNSTPADYYIFSDKFAIIGEDDNVINSGVGYTSISNNLRISPVAKAAYSPRALPFMLPRTTDDYYLWDYRMFIGGGGITMTTELCQDYVDALQSGTMFSAVSLPEILVTDTITNTYIVPLSFADGFRSY